MHPLQHLSFWLSRQSLSPLLLASCALSGCSTQAPLFNMLSLEHAETVDLVCLQVRGKDPAGSDKVVDVRPTPKDLGDCKPIPSGAELSSPNHLYALVPQPSRNSIAVVDLSFRDPLLKNDPFALGRVVNVDRSTPGMNMLPVGGRPQDLVVAPDGRIAYVSTTDPNHTALYALPTTRMLGNSQDLPGGDSLAPLLSEWPACKLPGVPRAMVLVPTSGKSYRLVMALQGKEAEPSTLIVLDPTPLLRGAGLDPSKGDTVAPGAFPACFVQATQPLQGLTATSWSPGPFWSDGTSSPTSTDLPPASPVCSADGQWNHLPASFAFPYTKGIPQAGRAVFDGTSTLYLADTRLPMIHQINLTDPEHPREDAPLLVTSLEDPTRASTVSNLALSPPSPLRGSPRVLYATETQTGKLMVFDAAQKGGGIPLRRPHPETDPFSPEDRLVAVPSFLQDRVGPDIPPLSLLLVRQKDPKVGDTDVALLGLNDGTLRMYNVSNAPLTPQSPWLTPHTPRQTSLGGDITKGMNLSLVSPPKLSNKKGTLPFTPEMPQLLPTSAQSLDPGTSLPQKASTGVQFSVENPWVHRDQTWTVTYEGALPFPPLSQAVLSSEDGFKTLTLRSAEARFCHHGVRGQALSAARAAVMQKTLQSPSPLPLQHTVEIQSALLPPEDPRWNSAPSCGYTVCAQTFGATEEAQTARSFVVQEAYQDRLVLQSIENKGAARHQLATCCFPQPLDFTVRAEKEWVAVGSLSGYLHPIEVGSKNACVESCSVQKALRNGSVVETPPKAPTPGRNSPVALRNPMFSFFVRAGTVPTPRGLTWRFSVTGSPTWLRISPFGSEPGADGRSGSLPQTMRWIPSFKKVLVVDAVRGLFFLDPPTFTRTNHPIL